MKRIVNTVFLLAFCVLGCANKHDSVIVVDQRIEARPSMDHKIDVPEQYRGGANRQYCISTIKRYIDAYDLKWWRCITNYASDINYQSTIHDWSFNGWPVALAGAEDGYKAAEEQVQKNIKQHGTKKTQAYLQQLLSDEY